MMTSSHAHDINFRDTLANFLRELKVAARTLMRAKGLTATVILTLALGIGANAAIFALVRGVLLRPLVNRDENHLIYIHHSAHGIGEDNAYFSVPEIQDLRSQVKTISAIGDFSIMGFNMVGLGEPREIQAGVVGGSYFQVMSLRAVLGRLLDARDDGPTPAGAVVLTYRFWKDTLNGDPSVIGRNVQLSGRSATIVGVLEASVPYPAETDILVNVVTSPHHLSATMMTGRAHRMTELFGRLAPGASLDSARAELRVIHAAMTKQHPDAYSANADFRIDAVLLRDQITSRARTVLLVLMAASILVFVIACANVANLILARTVRREGELGIRAALGASTGSLRRTLLSESLLLCSTGAILGVLSARPMVTILARYASRFSVRALDLTVDSSILWVSAAMAVLAAVFLAFVPRLPTARVLQGVGLGGNVRVTGGANRRLRIFAVIQIAASFLLLAGASMVLKTLFALQSAPTPFDTHHVLAIDIPSSAYGRTPDQNVSFYQDAIRRVTALPGVDAVAVGSTVPWRDAKMFGFGLGFSVDGYVRAAGEDDPRARLRVVSPGFFAALGVPIIAGRDFSEADRANGEPVVIISQTLAQQMFPNRDAVNRHLMWTDPVIKFVGMNSSPRRIVGVSADVDDENVLPTRTLTVYEPMAQQVSFAGRMFIHTRSNPYSLVNPVTRFIRDLSPTQVVERAATLQDIRAEVLTPDRLNSIVFGGFAAVALLVAVVGVAGVLVFSVTGRTREFGIRLALGAQRGSILAGVVAQGIVMAAIGVAAGAIFGYLFLNLAKTSLPDVKTRGILPVIVSAAILLVATVVASVLPANRAARVDVMQALRSD